MKDSILLYKITKVLLVIIRQIEINSVTIDAAKKSPLSAIPTYGAVNKAMMVISNTPTAVIKAGDNGNGRLASVIPCLRGDFTVLFIMQIHLRYYRFKLIDIGQCCHQIVKGIGLATSYIAEASIQ